MLKCRFYTENEPALFEYLFNERIIGSKVPEKRQADCVSIVAITNEEAILKVANNFYLHRDGKFLDDDNGKHIVEQVGLGYMLSNIKKSKMVEEKKIGRKPAPKRS